jgi:hypothetical protein
LQDPYVELAETILDLTEAVAGSGSDAGLREQLSLETACRYLAAFDLFDSGELKRCMVKMPDEVQAAILNTMSRQLSSRTENETANTSYVATSIETLSKFDIVGTRERPDTVLEPLAALLRIAPASLPAFPDPSPAAQALAQSLRNLSFMAKLLDLDLDVYNQVAAVLESSR